MDEFQGPYEGFTKQEMTCKCGCGLLPKHSFMLKLVELRKRIYKKFKIGLPISSGARCKRYNATIYKNQNPQIKYPDEKDGPHPKGLAADISCNGILAAAIAYHAYALGFQGIGIRQKNKSRFVHVDIVPRGEPTMWSY